MTDVLDNFMFLAAAIHDEATQDSMVEIADRTVSVILMGVAVAPAFGTTA